ncbi:hypothetical protein M422DRAFT_785888 [Sphaerobolus stellatus SS14]|uniref:Uncharacterized protein n=1 Tax=Sphaerobolus stellatus (strain SS14) TaxID=990650 RepID=A0A0C9T5X5_SPHS4|nr:hypothetical protein M422DRAFT_785888 [Sphaerobolus stellatus SS14]
MPGFDIPEIPDISIPDTSIPDTSIPDTSIPDTPIPGDDDGGQDGSSYSPPKSKDREPGTLHPLTVGVKKAVRDGAIGVYIAFTVLSAHQLIAALLKLCVGRRQRKGFQRTTKFKVLMVLTTMSLLTVNALGIAYIRLGQNLETSDSELQSLDGSIDDDSFLDLITSIWTIQTVDDFLAKVAQWLVIVSAVMLLYDYLAYKTQGGEKPGSYQRDPFKNAWEKYRKSFIILYVGASVLAIVGAVQLGIFMAGADPDTQETTRIAVAWVFAIFFGMTTMIFAKLYGAVKAYGTLPELNARGLKSALTFLFLLTIFFIVDAILISSSIDQNIAKLVEITVVGGLTASIVWSLLWEREIKAPTPTKASTPGWKAVKIIFRLLRLVFNHHYGEDNYDYQHDEDN